MTTALYKKIYSFIMISIIFQFINLSPLMGGQDKAVHSPDSISIGYSKSLYNEVDLSDARVAIKLYAKEIFKSYNLEINKSIIFSDLDSITKALNSREINLICLPPLDFLKIKDKTNIEPVLTGTKSGKVYVKYILLVHRQKGITGLPQLRNKRIFITSDYGLNDANLLWLDSELKKNGLPRTTIFFNTLKQVPKASQAILPVFFQQADAALVPRSAYDTMAELNPQIFNDLAILASSPPFPRGLTAFRKDIKADAKQRIIASALSLHTYPRGRQILTLFKTDQVVRSPNNYLENLIKLLGDHTYKKQ
jgi:ABC-type phosphate/phosphonate transport system substrate-binding protein